MPTLREIVTAETATAEELPLVHTTQRKKLDELRATHQLREPDCDVFCEPVVYFFYGRPAYRSLLGRDPGSGLELCPIGLVFRPGTVSSTIRRMFACDSGAVHLGLLEPHVAKTELTFLELDPTIDSARRLIPLIYGTNKNYFTTQLEPAVTPSFPAGEVADRWHRLIQNPTLTTCDDRMSAIEVQVMGPVGLIDSLLYVSLPSELLEDPEIRSTIFTEWKCDPLPYDVYHAAPPIEYYSDIRRAVREQYLRTHRI
ncbi:hypothetical protein [Coraliomargarita parva]|uniref:hypothetical protein n=1 Tax=Coraliomargarita parva TaxID=3014050 RepID=UPI0022B2CC12|nr:hypothetical protein [Coraliomargarita parva]